MQCAESLRVQAYFDREVDAVSAIEIERHVECCAECRARLRELEEIHTLLRQQLSYERAPLELRARIARALDQETAMAARGRTGLPQPARAAGLDSPTPSDSLHQSMSPGRTRRPSWRTRPFWVGALGGAGGTAIAAALAFFLLFRSLTDPLLDDIVAAHVRSLMPSHLIDVTSTDQHTVKPWFAGHTDVSPVVADFQPQGYQLIGGRADYLDHQRSAVVVYRHGAHVINVFSWRTAEGLVPADATRNGYHLAFWKAGNLEYCAVADTGWDELLRLERLLRDRSIAQGARR